MTRSMVRPWVVVTFILAVAYQGFAGAMSSLQLGAAGVGDRALWVPNVLIAETYTILTIGFILCLWGRPLGLRFAAICAVASLVVAVAAIVTLHPTGAPLDVAGSAVAFALLSLPGLALLGCVRWMRRAARREATG